MYDKQFKFHDDNFEILNNNVIPPQRKLHWPVGAATWSIYLYRVDHQCYHLSRTCLTLQSPLKYQQSGNINCEADNKVNWIGQNNQRIINQNILFFLTFENNVISCHCPSKGLWVTVYEGEYLLHRLVRSYATCWVISS